MDPTEDIVVGNLFNFVMTLPSTALIPPGKRKKKSASTRTTVSKN